VESLLYDVPVISTSKELEGFFSRNPTGGILIANLPAAFAGHINNILNNERLLQEQRWQAEEIFNHNFSFKHNALKPNRVFNNV